MPRWNHGRGFREGLWKKRASAGGIFLLSKARGGEWDFVQLKLIGIAGGRRRSAAGSNVMCHVGAEETMEPFNENLPRRELSATTRICGRVSGGLSGPETFRKKYHYCRGRDGIKTKKNCRN